MQWSSSHRMEISPEQMIVNSLSETDRTALWRAAVPRYLTRGVLEVLLPDEKQRERVWSYPLVEEASWDVSGEIRTLDKGLRGVLLSPFRAAGFSNLLDPEFQNQDALNETLAAYHAERGEEGEIEALYHRLGSRRTRAEALEEIERQVTARLRFPSTEAGGWTMGEPLSKAPVDVARAHSLIQLLEEREREGVPEAGQLRQRLLPKLIRRSLWAPEREASATYYSRAFERRAWEQVLADSIPGDGERWLLQLHAPGGSGKTMFVQNLLGRVCPAAEIPTARVDFDYVAHLVTSTHQPWRVLLLIARQLDRQIEGRPFQSFLLSWGHLEARTFETGLPLRREAAVRPEEMDQEERARAQEAVPKHFREILASSLGDRPVVVVLDTLENLLHTEDAALAGLVEELAEVRSPSESDVGVPGLKVVLSGRFDLASKQSLSWGGGVEETLERVKGFRERYVGDAPETDPEHKEIEIGKEIVTLFLSPFADSDADAYLTTHREIEEPELRAAIAEKAEGNPMKLSLLADAVDNDPKLGAEEIRSWPNAELFYLVHRVIDRITDPEVRWLVRWGVIPRLLTRRFVDDVLWPLFREQQAGGELLDDTGLEVGEVPAPSSGATRYGDVDPGLNASAAWHRLTEYAAGASWVSAVRDLPDALMFHNDVRDPMRGLLRSHDQKVYHLLNQRAFEAFQRRAEELEGLARAAALRGVVFHAFEPWRGRPEKPAEIFRQALEAVEDDPVLRGEVAREILDIERRAVRLDREDLKAPPPAALGLAHGQIALQLAQEVMESPALAPQLLGHLKRSSLPGWSKAWIEGGSRQATGDPEGAETLYRKALADPELKGKERAQVLLSSGRLTKNAELLEEARGSGDARIRREATEVLAETAFGREELQRALSLYQELGNAYWQGRCLLKLGRPRAARQLLVELEGVELAELVVRIALGFYYPQQVIDADTSALEAEDEPFALRMAVFRALARIQLAEEGPALSALESMASGHHLGLSIQANQLAAQVALHQERPLEALRYLGNLPEKLPMDLKVRTRLLTAEAEARHGRRDAALAHLEELDRLERDEGDRWLPSSRVAHALTRIQLLGLEEEGFARLVTALRLCDSPERRLYLLEGLARVGTPEAHLPETPTEEILQLLALDDATSISGAPIRREAPRQYLAWIELLRVLGKADTARDSLRPALTPETDNILWVLAARAMDRLGWTPKLLDKARPDPILEDVPISFAKRMRAEYLQRLADPPKLAGRIGMGPLLEPKPALSTLSPQSPIEVTASQGTNDNPATGVSSASTPDEPPYLELRPEPDLSATFWQKLAEEAETGALGLAPSLIAQGSPLLDRHLEAALEAIGAAGKLQERREGPKPLDLVIPSNPHPFTWIPWQLAKLDGTPLVAQPGVRCLLRSRPEPGGGRELPELRTLEMVVGDSSREESAAQTERAYKEWRNVGAEPEILYHWPNSWMGAGGRRPDVIHILATFEQRRGGEVVLRTKTEHGEVLGASHLARTLYGEPDLPPPLLLFDVPWMGNPFESAHQLLLRDLYLGELASRGESLSLLGVGFAEGDLSAHWLRRLVRGMVGGFGLGEIVGALQRFSDREELEHLLPGRATTLYTPHPDRIVRVGGKEES